MKIEEFIENSLAKLNASGYEQLKGKLVGEYLTFFFVNEKHNSNSCNTYKNNIKYYKSNIITI